MNYLLHKFARSTKKYYSIYLFIFSEATSGKMDTPGVTNIKVGSHNVIEKPDIWWWVVM